MVILRENVRTLTTRIGGAPTFTHVGRVSNLEEALRDELLKKTPSLFFLSARANWNGKIESLEVYRGELYAAVCRCCVPDYYFQIWKLKDGKEWVLDYQGPSSGDAWGSYVYYDWVSPYVRRDVLFFAGHNPVDGIVIYRKEGDTWSTITFGVSGGEFWAITREGNTLYASMYFWATDESRIYTSVDIGLTWTLLFTSIVAPRFGRCAETYNNRVYFGERTGAAPTAIREYNPATTVWTSIAVPLGEQVICLDVFAGKLWIGCNNGYLYSYDGTNMVLEAYLEGGYLVKMKVARATPTYAVERGMFIATSDVRSGLWFTPDGKDFLKILEASNGFLAVETYEGNVYISSYTWQTLELIVLSPEELSRLMLLSKLEKDLRLQDITIFPVNGDLTATGTQYTDTVDTTAISTWVEVYKFEFHPQLSGRTRLAADRAQLWIYAYLECGLRAVSSGTADVIWQWQGREIGEAAWIDLHPAVTEVNIGIVEVLLRRSGYIEIQDGLENIPMEFRLRIQCDELNEGRGRVVNSTYIRAFYRAE